MSRVLVTGATGRIGAHVVRELLDAGDDVVAFHRSGSNTSGLQGLDVEVRLGDLTDSDTVAAAVEGCELVFHVGAVHRNWAPRDEDFIGPNVDGTRHVMEAARAAGVRRVVVTASQATIGYTRDPDAPLDETHTNQELHLPYVRAKLEAEALALRLGQEEGPEVVVVNPTATVGPLDFRSTPTTAAVRDLFKGGPVLFGVNVVHARDVAAGHRLAALKGRPGERYILGGENLKRLELADLVARLTKGKPNHAMPPRALLAVAARVMPLVARFTGGDAPLSPDALATMWGHHMLYDSRKAREELGYNPRPAEEALRDALRWQAFMGWIPKKVMHRMGDELAPDPSWQAGRR
ncbi:MAG: NAD-dependent epimerase/dehydratase family protein [Deltaproteobacteria bacterium]|nr:NAD-dependent epimerase/dehydratase family protein [Deltaproteobacteria bacterium]